MIQEDVDLYTRVQAFYARQMGYLDEGQGDAWADTYTEDAVFSETRMPEPLRGREAIRKSVHGTIARRAEAGKVFRHWFGMLVVEPSADGSLRTRSYALTLSTPYGGGELTAVGHAVCRDELVSDGSGGFLIRHRSIVPDGV